jgi:hypothetical protein
MMKEAIVDAGGGDEVDDQRGVAYDLGDFHLVSADISSRRRRKRVLDRPPSNHAARGHD